MAAIGFYHLVRRSTEAALPALLGRALEGGHRSVIRCGSAERLDALDRALWVCAKPDWLPHGTTLPALQPIYLTLADENPGGATFLFLLDGTTSQHLGDYARVFDLFDGNDPPTVAAARDRWTEAKRAGHTLTYWQDGAEGWTRT